MRRTLVVAIGLAAGCGGGGNDPTPPPPPPSGPGNPATVAVQEGNNQRGAPGATLPVPPAVVVRDAAGRAVPNVSVTFRVDSGGGALTSGSAVSGADGVARGGGWQLGPGEGRQVVVAVVGSLTPARFVALALLPDVSYPSEVISTGGGVVTLSRPGQPLDGFQLEVPAGALTAAASVGLIVRSAAVLTLPDSVTAVTPLVAISTSAGLLTEPALIHFPGVASPGKIRAAVLRNSATGALRFLPTLVEDANGLTAALPDLAPAAAIASPAAGVAPAAATEQSEFEVALFELVKLWSAGDFDTGYRPGVDDWDFARQPIAGIPQVSPAPVIDPGESMLGTSLWYFLHQKTTGGPLWRKFQEAAGVPESNRRGLRWVGVTGQTFSGYWQRSYAASVMNTAAQQQPLSFALTQMNNTRLSLRAIDAHFGPIPVLLYAGSSVDAPRLALAYHANGNQVELAIPDQPGHVFQATFDANGVITPFTVATSGGGTFTVTAIGAGMFMNQLLESKLAAQWPTVVNGTIGDIAGWPVPTLRGHVQTDLVDTDVDLDPADLILGPAMLHWWKCGECPDNGYRSNSLDNRLLLWRRVSRQADGSYGALPPEFFPLARFSAADVAPALESTSGFALYQPGPGSSQEHPNGLAWLDWKTVKYRRLPIELSPHDPAIIDETEFTFTGTVPNAPAGVKYRWRVSSPGGGPPVYQNTPGLTLVQKVSDPGPTSVELMVLDDATKRILAADTSNVDFQEKPLSITPSPVNGAWDTDYHLTATYGLPLPPNPSWVWDLGDGRVITTPTAAVTIKYPAPVPLTERTFTLKLTLKSGSATEAIAKTPVVMGAPIYTAWKLTEKNTFLEDDTRSQGDGKLWADFVAHHGEASVWSHVWDVYRADSSFLFTGQSANAAVALVVRDTLLGPPFSPTTGFQRSLYWWTYGSFPTSPQTPLSAGIKGTNNTLTRGGTSCNFSYSARYQQTGTTTAGLVLGLNWVDQLTLIGTGPEPRVMFEYDVSFDGDVASGTIIQRYRITTDCQNPEVTWAYRTVFKATRVR